MLYRRMQLPIQQGTDADVVLPSLKAAVFVVDDTRPGGGFFWGLRRGVGCLCLGWVLGKERHAFKAAASVVYDTLLQPRREASFERRGFPKRC